MNGIKKALRILLRTEKNYFKVKRFGKKLINELLIVKVRLNHLINKKEYNSRLQTPRNSDRLKIYFLVTENNLNTVAGDFFSAYGLGEALRSKYGYNIAYLGRRPINEWTTIPDDADIIVCMLEDLDIRTIDIPPHTLKIAWVRGHIDEWYYNASINRFDGILATSQIALNTLSKKVGDKIWGQLPLAIPRNVEQEVKARDIEVGFIGNIYHIERDIVKNLDLNRGFKFVFFGVLEDKENHPWAPYHQGTIKNEEVKTIYSRSKIVIEDIAPFNRGTVNLRVFEAAACGALVIANQDEALEELFGEDIIMYRDSNDLTQKIEFYLNNEEERKRQAAKLQQRILQFHTFEERAKQFEHILQSKRER